MAMLSAVVPRAEVVGMLRVRHKTLKVEMEFEFVKLQVNSLFVHQEGFPPIAALDHDFAFLQPTNRTHQMVRLRH